MSAMLPPGLHSQQAGTILSTLMPTSPPQPPAGQGLQFPRSASDTYDRASFLSEIDSLPKRIAKPTAKVKTPQSPEPSSACRVALIGLGTVGRAVAKILSE